MTAFWVIAFLVFYFGIIAYGVIEQIRYTRKKSRQERLEQIMYQWKSFPDQPRFEADEFIWWYLTEDGWKAFWVF